MTDNNATAEQKEEAPLTKEQQLDRAAMDFKIMMPVFKRFIAALSNKAKDRVVNAILEFPLYDKDPIFQSARERDLFDIGIRLVDAKTAMIQAVYQEKINKELEEAANNLKEKENEANV